MAETELKVILKAKDLCEHTLRVTYIEAWWIRKFIDDYGKDNVMNISIPKITMEDLQREYANIVGGQLRMKE